MNEGSPFEFSIFEDQFIVVCQVLAAEKLSAISPTNYSIDGR